VVDEQAAAEARAAASIGAQIILDFNEDGSIGARGGAAADINGNTAVRDAHLVALGLDPVNPSGPPAPGQLPSGKATRVSSLAISGA
jgi:hypothetical protein